MFVGNDVVDLTHPENRGKSQDQRFLNRVFTTDEQNLISKSSSPDATLWALWAAKESAYKVCHKVNHKISSIPKHYEVRLLDGESCNLLPAECMLSASRGSFQNEVCGNIHTSVRQIDITLFMGFRYVHCIGTLHPGEGNTLLHQKVFFVGPAVHKPDNASFYVRQIARRHLALCLRKQPSDIHINRLKSPSGLAPPMVCIDNIPTQQVDISLSHDGGYIAYTFTIHHDGK